MSVAQFLRVIGSSLNQEQIVSIGPIRIDVQTTRGNNSPVLVIQGSINLGDSIIDGYKLSGEAQLGGNDICNLEFDNILLQSNIEIGDFVFDNPFPTPHSLSQQSQIESSSGWNDHFGSDQSAIFSSSEARPFSTEYSLQDLDGTQCSPDPGLNSTSHLSMDKNGPFVIPPTLPSIDKRLSNILYSSSSTTSNLWETQETGFAIPSFSENFLQQPLRKTPRTAHSSNSLIISASRNILRDDYLTLLESELPRWIREGLWNETRQSVPGFGRTSLYKDLERAYSCVCRLDARMGDDDIRHRMALIRLHLEYTKTYQEWKNDPNQATSTGSTIGRGDATLIIDAILENIYEGWRTLDHRHRSDLRAKFHNRKKYGKRWSHLVDMLGPGVLLLCSAKVANIVRNTTVSAKTLEAIARRVQTSEEGIMRTLAIIKPLSECLFMDDGYSQYDGAEILWQIQNAMRANA